MAVAGEQLLRVTRVPLLNMISKIQTNKMWFYTTLTTKHYLFSVAKLCATL